MWKYLVLCGSLLCIPVAAFAGDAVTLLFREGHIVQMDYGYAAIVDAFRKLDGQGDTHRIIELNIEGGSFLLDLSEVVVVCRDRCSSLLVTDPRRQTQKN